MTWRAVQFDWNRARAFLVTAEEGSFSAAARALGTTQPTIGRQVAALEEEYAEMARMGAVRWAKTPRALAKAGGIDPVGFAETVETYNAAARGAVADPFGRVSFALAPLQPPLGILTVKPGLFHTQGGLLVDGHARVRRECGGVIPNLFAGGGAAVGISGRSGAGGYASGNGLLTALALGQIAGLRAAAEVKGEA